MAAAAVRGAMEERDPLAETSDIAQVGRVHMNGTVDVHELQRSIRRGLDAYYGKAAATTDHMTILAGEIVISEKRRGFRNASINASVTQRFRSTLNGAYSKKDTLADIRARTVLGGVASTQARADRIGASYMATNLAVAVGGMRTIRNTGPDYIAPGDLIVMEFPDKNATISQAGLLNVTDGNMPRDRLLMISRVFRPEQSLPSVKTLSEYVTAKMEHGRQADKNHREYGLHCAGDKLCEAMKRYAIIAMIKAAQDGDLLAILQEQKGKFSGAGNDADNDKVVDETATRLDQAMGNHPPGTVPAHGAAAEAQKKRKAALVGAMLGWDMEKHGLVKTAASNPRYKDLNTWQMGATSALIGSISTAYHDRCRFIIGRATRAAAPGAKFDILVGSQMM